MERRGALIAFALGPGSTPAAVQTDVASITSRDFTVECLLLADWSMEAIEVVWFWGGNL